MSTAELLYWTAPIGYEKLTDLLSANLPIQYGHRAELHSIDHPKPGSIRLGRWHDDQSSDRWDLVLVHDGEQRDFLAWLSTYFPAMAPVTQWCRVVEGQELAMFAEDSPSAMASWAAHLWANVVLGECFAQMREPSSLASVSTQAALSCQSFIAARSRAVGHRTSSAEEGVALWSKLLEATGHPRRLTHDQMGVVWNVLDVLIHHPRELPRAGLIGRVLERLALEGKIPNDAWGELSRDVGSIDVSMPEEITREERLRKYDLLTRKVVAENVRTESVAFLVGCAASSVGNGRLEFLDLLKPVLQQVPTAPLWFALHSGLVARGAVGAEFSGFGRRVAREILAPTHAKELGNADLSAAEFLMMATVDARSVQSVRGFIKGSLLLEVAPFVVAALPVGRRDNAQTFHENTQAQGAARDSVLRAQIRDALSRSIHTLEVIKSELESEYSRSAPVETNPKVSAAGSTPRQKKSKTKTKGLFG